ncbi:MAG: hypothetical protein GY796_02995, partial [Chloroflexi bacterium]|nr:hypothetical protein [Chloroflexota bacterium]
MRNLVWGLLILLLGLAACQQEKPIVATRPLPTGPALATVIPTSTPVEPTEPTIQPGGIVAEEVMPDNPPPVWQSPIPPLPDLARTAVTPEQQRTAQLLSQS